MSTPSQCPVRFDTTVGMWVVADPAMVRNVLLQPAIYGPDNALTAYRTLSPRSLRILNTVGFSLPPTLANNAGPSHKKIRQTVAKFFAPGRVNTLQPLIADLVQDRLPALRSTLARDNRADLVNLVAAQVPAATLLQVIGMHGVNIEQLKTWSRDSLELFWGTPHPDRQEHLAGQAAEFYHWLRQRVIQERRTPGEGLLAALTGTGLNNDQICSIGYFLLIAGQETTSQLISTVFWAALKDPPTWSRCGHDPAYLAHVTDTALAQTAPVPTWRRILNHPTRLAGDDLPAGTELLLQLTGNGGGPDLAFGAGIHRCLGARLAKLETHVAVHEVAAALPNLLLLDNNPPMIDLLSFRAPAQLWATTTNPEDNPSDQRPGLVSLVGSHSAGCSLPIQMVQPRRRFARREDVVDRAAVRSAVSPAGYFVQEGHHQLFLQDNGEDWQPAPIFGEIASHFVGKPGPIDGLPSEVGLGQHERVDPCVAVRSESGTTVRPHPGGQGGTKQRSDMPVAPDGPGGEG